MHEVKSRTRAATLGARWTSACTILALVLVSTSALPSDFETLQKYDRDTVLPSEVLVSDDYTIDAEVGHDGYVYQYALRSRFGNWAVPGNSLLRARLREIQALAELENHSGYKVAVDSAIEGLIEAGRSPFVIAGALSQKPVETVMGLPSGVKRSLSRRYRQVKGAVGEAGESVSGSEDGDGFDEEKARDQAIELGEQWMGISDAELSWARQLEVDPYSTNQVLNKAIQEIARYDAAGQFAAGLAVPSIPAVRIMKTVHNVVWETHPEDLQTQNRNILAGLGIEQSLIDEFFDNPWFSPTMQTVITRAVQDMEGVENLAAVFADMRQIQTEEASRFAAESVAMLAWIHSSVSPLVRMSLDARMPIGLTGDGISVTCLAIDRLAWTETIAEVMSTFKVDAGNRGGDMYFTGTVSDRSRRELKAAGWRIHERFEAGLETNLN